MVLMTEKHADERMDDGNICRDCERQNRQQSGEFP